MKLLAAIPDASHGSADFQSAVSPISNRQGVENFENAGSCRRPAECNSAIRQTANLRYNRGTVALSLIEVMIAMALFFMVVFAILGMVSNTLRNARRLQEEYVDAGAVASHLCLSNRLEEGSFDFDFGDLYPDYRGTYDVTPITNGLFRIEILVENERQRSAAPSTMTIMLFRPDSPAGPGIGFR